MWEFHMMVYNDALNEFVPFKKHALEKESDSD